MQVIKVKLSKSSCTKSSNEIIEKVLKSLQIVSKTYNIHEYCLTNELCHLLDESEKQQCILFRQENSHYDYQQLIFLLQNEYQIQLSQIIEEKINESREFINENNTFCMIGSQLETKVFFRYYFQDLKMGKTFQIKLYHGDVLFFPLRHHTLQQNGSDEIQLKNCIVL